MLAAAARRVDREYDVLPLHEELAPDLLKQQGVHVHPGHFYDFSQDGYLVVSLITPELEFAEGMRRLLSSFG